MEKNNTELNKLRIDENGNVYGIFAISKPPCATSHDIVNTVRKILQIRKVGHSGTLDPFATGVLIILVGRSTKRSNEFLNLDKEYEFQILLGVATETQDPEGKVLRVKGDIKVIEKEVQKVLKKFTDNYNQTVPVFSSVKVNGIRLRELARSSMNIRIFKKEDHSFAEFSFDRKIRLKRKISRQLDKSNKILIKLPKREVKIHHLRLISIENIKSAERLLGKLGLKKDLNFTILKIRSKVSKGTYIRQLAVDIGKELGDLPSSLLTLKRTMIGDISIENCLKLGELQKRI